MKVTQKRKNCDDDCDDSNHHDDEKEEEEKKRYKDRSMGEALFFLYHIMCTLRKVKNIKQWFDT